MVSAFFGRPGPRFEGAVVAFGLPGVPAQATFALTCVCAALLGGLIKHHILIEQGDIAELPGLFAKQLATAAIRLDGASIDALGYLQPDVGAFITMLSDRLAVVAADFAPPLPRPSEATAGEMSSLALG